MDQLQAAQYASAGMAACAERGQPSPETTSEIMSGRTLVARHASATVKRAMETAGGAAFRDRGRATDCGLTDHRAGWSPRGAGDQMHTLLAKLPVI